MSLLGILFSLFILIQQGCCPPCNKGNQGVFPILDETETWFGFVDTRTRLFTSTAGGQRNFTYDTPVRTNGDLQDNCEETACSLCCDEFTVETLTYRMTDGNAGLAFQIQVEKDFSQEGGPDDKPDILLFSLNNSVRCSAGNIPEGAILTNITLNGKTFNGVIACEINIENANSNQENIYAYYFQPGVGIVGFVQSDGTEWALSN